MLSGEWLSRYGVLESFNASVTRTRTRTGTVMGTWTTGVTAIALSRIQCEALCTSCSRAKNGWHVCSEMVLLYIFSEILDVRLPGCPVNKNIKV